MINAPPKKTEAYRQGWHSTMDIVFGTHEEMMRAVRVIPKDREEFYRGCEDACICLGYGFEEVGHANSG